jgi:hypothetical protein
VIELRPVPVLQWSRMRLRSLTEAECYARCYGGRREEPAAALWQPSEAEGASAATARGPRDQAGALPTVRTEPRTAA